MTVVTGCAVVCRFRVVELLPLPFNVTVLLAKLHCAPAGGGGVQVSEILAPNTPPRPGLRITLYCAVPPAATVRLEGAMETEKPDDVNVAVAVLLVFVSLLLDTVAVA